MDDDTQTAKVIHDIAHKVRTPLSVITNELSFLESKLQPEELNRLKRASESITNTLKEYTQQYSVQKISLEQKE